MAYQQPPPYSQQPPPGFYQPQPVTQQHIHYQAAPPPTVIIQTVAPSAVPLNNNPTRVICPSCHATVVTSVVRQPSGRTHLWALLLCLFVCWPCVCVPYCMDSCQNANHYCPNCNAFIGTYQN